MLKALSLGAKACAGGRLYLYALAAAGQKGVEKALSMITSGASVSASDALKSGIIEEVFEDALVANAISFIKSKLQEESHPVASKLKDKISNIDSDIFEEYSKKIKNKLRGRNSPL